MHNEVLKIYIKLNVGSPRSYGGPDNSSSAYGMMFNSNNMQLATPVNTATDFYGRAQTGKAGHHLSILILSKSTLSLHKAYHYCHLKSLTIQSLSIVHLTMLKLHSPSSAGRPKFDVTLYKKQHWIHFIRNGGGRFDFIQ